MPVWENAVQALAEKFPEPSTAPKRNIPPPTRISTVIPAENPDPETASRPFDADRNGFVLSEGAATLILESDEHARARGARVYCEVAGYGASDDAHHITAPDPKGTGATLAMRWALRDAGAEPDEVSYINAHGTSTQLNDAAETRAIKAALGEEDAHRVAVSSTKSMTGHLLGAAGGLEAGITALAVYHQVAPPTINQEHRDDECDLDYIPNVKRAMKIEYALSNSFGFGGTNAALLFKRFDSNA